MNDLFYLIFAVLYVFVAYDVMLSRQIELYIMSKLINKIMNSFTVFKMTFSIIQS